jgi:hypothetical protein
MSENKRLPGGTILLGGIEDPLVIWVCRGNPQGRN